MNKSEKVFVSFISVISFIIIGITFISYNLSKLINFKYFVNSNEYIFHTDKLGHFGDFIGGFLGTLLTGIATYFVYKTYISQKDELEKQKEELILNRQLIAQQQFESTFFNMLNVHRELKKEFKINIIERITNLTPIREELEPELIVNTIHPTTIININDFQGIDVLNFIRQEFEILFKSFKDLSNSHGSQTFGGNIINGNITQY